MESLNESPYYNDFDKRILENLFGNGGTLIVNLFLYEKQ